MGIQAFRRCCGLWVSTWVVTAAGCNARTDDPDTSSAPQASGSSSAAATVATSPLASHPSMTCSPSGAVDGGLGVEPTSGLPEAGGNHPGTSDAQTGTFGDASNEAAIGAKDPEPSVSLAPDTAPSERNVQDASSDASLGIEPYLEANIAGRVIEFRDHMLTYNGRPPTMDVFAGSEDPEWLTLRVFVGPGDLPKIVPGDYPCGLGNSYVMLIGGTSVYDSNSAPGNCTVRVTEAGLELGEVFSGTFSGTLVQSGGTSSVTVADGKFYGVVN